MSLHVIAYHAAELGHLPSRVHLTSFAFKSSLIALVIVCWEFHPRFFSNFRVASNLPLLRPLYCITNSINSALALAGHLMYSGVFKTLCGIPANLPKEFNFLRFMLCLLFGCWHCCYVLRYIQPTKYQSQISASQWHNGPI